MIEKCSCNHCSGHIEFDASQAGQTIACPHCELETRLHIPKATSDIPPQNISVEIKRGVNPLGVASLVLGVFACAFCWIPFLGLLAIPLGAIGLLLAVIGMTSKKNNPALPLGGGVVCITAILIAFFVTGGISSLIAKGKQTNQEQVSKSTRQPPSIAEEWSKSPTVKQGDIQVVVEKFHIGTVNHLDVLGRPQETEAKLLTINLAVVNLSSTKKVGFRTWRGVGLGLGGDFATLTDNNGNDYKRIDITPTMQDGGDAYQNTASIYPQKQQFDQIVFEPPVENIEFLHLQLPAGNFDGKGMLRFEIPMKNYFTAKSEIQKARDEYASFQASAPFVKNPDYVEIQNKITALDSQFSTLKQRSETLTELVDRERNVLRPRYTAAQLQKWEYEVSRLRNECLLIRSQKNLLYDKLTEIENAASAVYKSKIATAESRLADAETNLEALQR